MDKHKPLEGGDPDTPVSRLPISIDASDVDSSNNIYAGSNDTLMKSVDGGVTWTAKYTIPDSPTTMRCCFVDSRDYIYISGWKADDGNTTGDLLRSTDGGDNFSQVIDMDNGTAIWGIDEDSNGYLYVGDYSYGETGKGIIWRSTDGGANWDIVYQASEVAGIYHIHDLRVNPSNDWIYASTGDAIQRLLRSKDGGDSWTAIRGDSEPKFMAISFLNGDVYLGTDTTPPGNGIYKLVDDGTATPPITEFFMFEVGYDDFVLSAASYGDKMIFGTSNPSQIDHHIWMFDGSDWSSLDSVAAGDPGYAGYAFISRSHRSGVFYSAKRVPAGKINALAVDLVAA